MMPALPNLFNAVLAWAQPLNFVLVSKTVQDFQVSEEQISYCVMGTKQPLSPQRLAIKPEGQRDWKWYQLHLPPNPKINIDDIIRFDANDQYRVMAKSDFTEYGYVYYEIVQGFE